MNRTLAEQAEKEESANSPLFFPPFSAAECTYWDQDYDKGGEGAVFSFLFPKPPLSYVQDLVGRDERERLFLDVDSVICSSFILYWNI